VQAYDPAYQQLTQSDKLELRQTGILPNVTFNDVSQSTTGKIYIPKSSNSWPF